MSILSEMAAAVWAHAPRTLGEEGDGVERSELLQEYAAAVWAYVTRTVFTTYDGPDVTAALQAWWAAQTQVHELVAPFDAGNPVDEDDPDAEPEEPYAALWHLEAPEGQDPPFVVFFVVSDDECEPRSTAYAGMEAVVQFTAHATTDVQAIAIRKAIRSALLDAPLSIDGVRVRHCLPGGQGVTVGEGFLRGGRDSKAAYVEASIQYETDIRGA